MTTHSKEVSIMTHSERIRRAGLAGAALAVLLLLGSLPAYGKGGQNPDGKPPNEVSQLPNAGGAKLNGTATVIVFAFDATIGAHPVEAYVRLRRGKKVSAEEGSLLVFYTAVTTQDSQDPGVIQDALQNSDLPQQIIDAWFADEPGPLEAVVKSVDEFTVLDSDAPNDPPPAEIESITMLDLQVVVREVPAP